MKFILCILLCIFLSAHVYGCFISPNTLRLLGIPTYDTRERENYERAKDAFNQRAEKFLEVERQHKRLVAKMFNITLTEDTAIPWGLRPWWELEEEEEYM